MQKIRIALAGNPNVGKSTVFNALTGLHQHTGNWSGKTVDSAQGEACLGDCRLEVTDLPGTYSLTSIGNEEEIAKNFLCSDKYDVAIVICDATVLERNLILALQVLEITSNTVICINMMDEAEKKGIEIDCKKLSDLLGVPVCPCSARSCKGIDNLVNAAVSVQRKGTLRNTSAQLDVTNETVNRAHELAQRVCSIKSSSNDRNRKIDRILTGKYTAVPIMLLLLAIILFITIYAANFPSELLTCLFSFLQSKLTLLLQNMHVPSIIISLLCDGIFKTVAWVVAVMLPPMAIFFPMFTLLEDVGYLPRIAFNLDRWFRRSGACGKQALTTCMGFGCNAVGVTGCRIIESQRERTIAQLTNNFAPCNGRFPTLIAIITMFVVTGSHGIAAYGLSAITLTAFIVAGIMMTLSVSKFLSGTILRGESSSFVLELPPYRAPQFGKVIINSLLNRTIFVLGRALAVAAPAGLIIWILANISVGQLSLLQHVSSFLDPLGRLLGMDGVILLAFILGFPANEIVIPIVIMAYTCSGSLTDISNLAVLKQLLTANGWTSVTAICTMLFSIMHWPCSTTCITLYKETHSIKKTALAVFIPTMCGMIICFSVSMLSRIFLR